MTDVHASATPGPTSPTVSVVIPSHNCERYIAETIESVLAQTFGDLEVIVVDDGSTDRTREIVASFDSRVRLVAQGNAGVCRARNRGISEARGRYICLMDHDDYWFPDKIERQVEILEGHPEYAVAFAAFVNWHADAGGEFPPPTSYDLSSLGDGIDEDYSGWIYHQFLLDCWMLTSTAMFRREVFATCGVFDETLPYSEDWDLWLRLSREFQFVKLRRPNTLYRQHAWQGNRRVREIDYRTVLLERTVQQWGYCSGDGRCVSHRQFSKKLAEYHASYALHQLQAGDLARGLRAMIKAFSNNPTKLRYLAYAAVSLLGWRPRR